MDVNKDGISIGIVSGGIVNFGGAGHISPISITKTISGAGGDNSGAEVTTNTGLTTTNQKAIKDILELIRQSLS